MDWEEARKMKALENKVQKLKDFSNLNHMVATATQEKLEAENARLRKERDFHIKSVAHHNEKARAEIERLKSLLVQMYNKGYRAGHHDTVEAQCVDILDEDMDIYHADVVNGIIAETE